MQHSKPSMSETGLKQINQYLACVSINKTEELDFEEVVATLKELRLSLASDSEKDSSLLTDIVDRLFVLLQKLYPCLREDEQKQVAFRIGLQCVVNAMVAHEGIRVKVSNEYLRYLIEWLESDDVKIRNYVSAALHNLACGGLSLEAFESETLLSIVVESAMNLHVDFSHFLLEKLIERGKFVKLFSVLQGGPRIYFVHTLKSLITKDQPSYEDEVKFLVNTFKKQTDSILKTVSDYVERIDVSEVSHVLEVLAGISYLEKYQKVLQADMPLVINCVFLLRAVHQATGTRSDLFQVLEDAVAVIDNASDAIQHPTFGFKGHLIQLLGNLSWRHREIQDTLRDLECIPVLLECCAIDPNNPFIQQWSILALRNLAEGNLDNQKYIRETQPDKNRAVLEELRLTLNNDGERSVNVAPVVRKGK